MPIYEYECKECDKELEVLQSISESLTGIICVGCNKKMTKKVSLISGHRYYGGPNEGFSRTNIKTFL